MNTEASLPQQEKLPILSQDFRWFVDLPGCRTTFDTLDDQTCEELLNSAKDCFEDLERACKVSLCCSSLASQHDNFFSNGIFDELQRNLHCLLTSFLDDVFNNIQTFPRKCQLAWLYAVLSRIQGPPYLLTYIEEAQNRYSNFNTVLADAAIRLVAPYVTTYENEVKYYATSLCEIGFALLYYAAWCSDQSCCFAKLFERCRRKYSTRKKATFFVSDNVFVKAEKWLKKCRCCDDGSHNNCLAFFFNLTCSKQNQGQNSSST
jgi:hypothetical protein